MPRTLSKSRFKLAVGCPTNVFYSLDRRYVNAKDGIEFMHVLADGGAARDRAPKPRQRGGSAAQMDSH